MNKKIASIKKFLIRNNLEFFLFTNSDIHLNESPNLNLKDIYELVGFDCSRGYLLIFLDKIVFFTDTRYTLAANKYFKKNILVFDIQKNSIFDYLTSLGHDFEGGVDPNLISISEFQALSQKLMMNKILLRPILKSFIKKAYYPDFTLSYAFSLPRAYVPRSFEKNILWIKHNLKSEGFIIWNNAHISYLLNIKSFELDNSTKPFAGLFISKREKPIMITSNKSLEEISKIKKSFLILNKKEFIKYIIKKKIKSIEIDFHYTNYEIYLSLINITQVINSNIDIDKYLSKKTLKEFNKITLAHIEDGLAITKFILKIKNKYISFKNEYTFINQLYNLRKEGINFFRNSFDYISAFDENAAIVHYKPTINTSTKYQQQSILLLDSGAHYLEGTTDVTRVIKLNKINNSKIKSSYTYLLKSLIKIENTIFPKGITGAFLDNYIRNYLAKYNITYGHGTGHGVGYFNDVHEKYPLISKNFDRKLLNNNFFSIEPGYYLPDNFGLRIENLYFSKINKDNLTLYNVTLVPYELELIRWSLLSKKEIKHIKNYHKKIYQSLENRLNEKEKKDFTKFLIDKL